LQYLIFQFVTKRDVIGKFWCIFAISTIRLSKINFCLGIQQNWCRPVLPIDSSNPAYTEPLDQISKGKFYLQCQSIHNRVFSHLYSKLLYALDSLLYFWLIQLIEILGHG